MTYEIICHPRYMRFHCDRLCRIDFLEFILVYNIMSGKQPRVILEKMFDIFDVDQDGFVSKTELETVCTFIDRLKRS